MAQREELNIRLQKNVNFSNSYRMPMGKEFFEFVAKRIFFFRFCLIDFRLDEILLGRLMKMNFFCGSSRLVNQRIRQSLSIYFSLREISPSSLAAQRARFTGSMDIVIEINYHPFIKIKSLAERCVRSGDAENYVRLSCAHLSMMKSRSKTKKNVALLHFELIGA